MFTMSFEKRKDIVNTCMTCGMDMDLVDLLMVVISTTNDVAGPLKNGILQNLQNIKRSLTEE